MTEPEHPPALTKDDRANHDTANAAGQGYRGEPASQAFFDNVADAIVSELDPGTVLDMGCGIGLLVAALRGRGVEAWGIDASASTIAQVPVEFRSYCSVASLTDELERDYDLITCIDVLERERDDLAPEAVANVARHTESVLFSGRPSDVGDPTHLDVRPTEYWVGLFARHGFVRNFDLDVAFVAPHAIHLRRIKQTAAEVARGDERWHPRALTEVHELRAARIEERHELAAARKEVEQRRSEARSATAALHQLESTRTFRYTRALRRIYARMRKIRDRRRETYDLWVQAFDTLTEGDRKIIRTDARRLMHQPLISVLMPIYDAEIRDLERAVNSVRSQLYENWELCVAYDASSGPNVQRGLHAYASSDPRIKLLFDDARRCISAASNDALEQCIGEFVAVLDQDHELPPHALYLVVREINLYPDAALIFSDEDKIDAKGRRSNPYFKSDWNPDLFRSQNCIGDLVAYRRSVADEVGGFRVEFEGSHGYDLSLRVVERVRNEQVRHIPAVLYHSRTTPGSASDAASNPDLADSARIALVDHAHRTGRSVEVEAASNPSFNRLIYTLPKSPPLVSIVIPTRDGDYFRTCVESLTGLTTYPSYEIIVVDNQSADEMRAYLRSLSNREFVRILEFDDVFNHSAICNLAAREARGDVLCLLNDDVEILTPAWLDEMVSHALRPEVGAVGAKLMYPDGTIQHAGVILGLSEVAGHAHCHMDARAEGYFGRAALVQNFSAVTAACLVIRASVYKQVDGFDEEHLPHIYNDVDFCLRVREAGYWNVWTPYAELTHHESATIRTRPPRDPDAYARNREHVDYMWARWGRLLANDPAYNPGLTLASPDFSLGWPPRTEWPWTRRPERDSHLRR